MAKEKLIRLSSVKGDLKFHGVEIDYAKLVAYIEEYYPYIKISDKPHLSSVPERIAVEIIKELAHPTESTRDAKEHLYLLLPSGGNFIVPRNAKNRGKRGMIKIGATVYGTMDLAEYANKLDDDCTIHDLADYMKRRHYAEEITYEEFKGRALKGTRAPRAQPKSPVDLTRTDKWERKDTHLEILRGREPKDERILKA